MSGDSAIYNDYIESTSNKLVIKSNLEHHIQVFSETIGERNIFNEGSLEQSAKYIEGEFNKANLQVSRQKYQVKDTNVFNVIGEKLVPINPLQ